MIKMPAYDFQPQFADDVATGRKRSTIRAPRKDGRKPKPGQPLYLFTRQRSKHCRRLLTTKVARVTPIRITRGAIWLGRGTTHRADAVEQEAIAVADGFQCVRHLKEFFERTHGLPFRGYWIEWDFPEKHVLKPKIVCLCGSMRFYQEFQKTEYDFELAGYIVLTPGFSPNVSVHAHGGNVDITAQQKKACDELHRRKIDLADEVFVLNVGGYIGKSTRGEIEYAERAGRPVRYLEAL